MTWWRLDLRALALLRMSYGALVVIDVLIRFSDLVAHYSDDGLAPRDFILQHYWWNGQFSIYMLNGSWPFVAALFLAAMGAGVCLSVAYRTRLATLLCWIHLVSLHSRNLLICDGGDPYFRVIMFWAIFLPWGDCWSVDASRRPARVSSFDWFDVGAFAFLLQLGSVYFFAALLKTGPEWRSQGSATYYALMVGQLTTPLAPSLLAHPDLMRWLTFGVVATESLGPARAATTMLSGQRWQSEVPTHRCGNRAMDISRDFHTKAG